MIRAFLSALALAAIGVTGLASKAPAAEIADCGALSQGMPANPIQGGAVNDYIESHLKRSGPKNFVPDPAAPDALCLADRFQIQSRDIQIIYAGPSQHAQSLLYRIEIAGTVPRELTVLYSAEFNLMSGTHHAYSVAETRGNHVELYVIYDREPPYSQIRATVEAIVTGAHPPVMSAVWQEDGREPAITFADAD